MALRWPRIARQMPPAPGGPRPCRGRGLGTPVALRRWFDQNMATDTICDDASFEQLRDEFLRKDRLEDELRRFMHPWTGVRLPDVVDFEPRSCSIIDDGKVNCEYRGLIYYLATGGSSSEKYVNPGDKVAVIERIRQSRAATQKRLHEIVEHIARLEDMLNELQSREPCTEDDVRSAVVKELESRQLANEIQGVLRLDTTRSQPNFAQLAALQDELRRLNNQAAGAHNRSERLLRAIGLRRTLSSALAAHRDELLFCKARARDFHEAEERIAGADGGLVSVDSCAWQRGRAIDVLGGGPAYSWSDYVWEPGGAPWHPRGERAGAWFEVLRAPSSSLISSSSPCSPLSPRQYRSSYCLQPV